MYHTTLQLTFEDKKELKYNCRAGIIVPILFFLISSSIITYVEFYNMKEIVWSFTKIQIIIFSEFIVLIISFLIGYLMIHKLVSDIRNGEKIIEVKKISQKDQMEDYEAGSGNPTTIYNQTEMNAFQKYSIIVENYLYRVDKELYEAANIGDEVYFHYAPISKYLIKITLKRDLYN
jgi:hypothetical protein